MATTATTASNSTATCGTTVGSTSYVSTARVNTATTTATTASAHKPSRWDQCYAVRAKRGASDCGRRPVDAAGELRGIIL